VLRDHSLDGMRHAPDQLGKTIEHECRREV
jgi:hypothetical protein